LILLPKLTKMLSINLTTSCFYAWFFTIFFSLFDSWVIGKIQTLFMHSCMQVLHFWMLFELL
jgi:hypothetical protein